MRLFEFFFSVLTPGVGIFEEPRKQLSELQTHNQSLAINFFWGVKTHQQVANAQTTGISLAYNDYTQS